MNTPAICLTCRFYRPSFGKGECGRFPPLPIQGHKEILWAFPEVQEDDSCGEWDERGNSANIT